MSRASESKMPDVSEASHELTEVATDAQLHEKNGRLLVQTSGRHVVLRARTCKK